MPIRGAKDLLRIVEDVSELFGKEILGSMYVNNGSSGRDPYWGDRVCFLKTVDHRLEAHQFLRGSSQNPPHISVSVYGDPRPLFRSDLEENATKSKLEDHDIKIMQTDSILHMHVEPSEEALRSALTSFYEIYVDMRKKAEDYAASIR